MRPLGTAYEEVRGRIGDLISGLDGDATTPVPACPEWSVHGVLSHLTGICADILAGNLAGSATESWTRAQVNARADRTLAEVLIEWEQLASRFAHVLDDFPGRTGEQIIADIATHEHDIRGALGCPGSRDSDQVGIGVDFLLGTFFHAGLASSGLGPLEVRAGGRVWCAGTGGPRVDADEAVREMVWGGDTGPPAVSPPVGMVTADRFDLFRALTGRRSARQIRAYEWKIGRAHV